MVKATLNDYHAYANYQSSQKSECDAECVIPIVTLNDSMKFHKGVSIQTKEFKIFDCVKNLSRSFSQLLDLLNRKGGQS